VNEQPTIQDYMAKDLATLMPDLGIAEAVGFLLKHDISGAPVVDEAGRLVGLLSMKDCLRAALEDSYHQEFSTTVADHMSADVQTLNAEMDIVSAAKEFLTSRYRRFPVLRDGRLVGQISRSDVLRALNEHW